MDRRLHLAATLGTLLCIALAAGCGDRTPVPTPASNGDAQSSTTKEPTKTPPSPTAAVSPSPSGMPTGTPTVSAPASTANDLTATAAKDEVKIMKEYWEGTRILKFTYEMRRSANGRWERNGMSKAYYASGSLEREGPYKDGKRVGMWTYYDVEGKVLRTENRGGASREAPGEAPSEAPREAPRETPGENRSGAPSGGAAG